MSSTISTDGISRSRLDTLRGLACILLVGYHAIEMTLLYLSATSQSLLFINQALTPIRMPLFSFLSGIVYAYRPMQRDSVGAFAAGKLRRLVVPFITLTIVMLTMKTIVSTGGVDATVFDTPHYLVYAYSHLWFLQAILIVFCVYALADYLWPEHPASVAGAMIIVGIAAYLSPLRQVAAFSIGDGLYLLPFFAAGVAVNRWQSMIFPRKTTLVVLIAGLLAISMVAGIASETLIGEASRKSIVGLLAGLSGVTLLLLCLPGWRPLAWIGGYSFTIFLFHPIFAAIAVRLGPADLPLLLSFTFIIALFAPIAVELFIIRFTPFFGWVIGQRSRLAWGPKLARESGA